jgi:hypothetical protein
MNRLRTWFIVAANTALLFWLLQIGAYAILVVYDNIVLRLLRPPMSEAERQNFAHLSPEDFDDLERATGRLRFRFEPGIGVLQAEIQSRLVNVDRYGIRANGRSPRGIGALNGSIWVLGGSTTFGEFVADHETIPAQLERAIRRPVMNLGVPSYATPQENVLLAHYLRAGYRPALVLFLDGVNEACQPEHYMDEMRELFRRAQLQHFWDLGGPAQQLAVRVSRKSAKIGGWYREPPGDELACERNGVPVTLAAVHARQLAERAGLCATYGVECRTLVQPFAGTHGPSRDLPKAFLEGEAVTLRTIYTQLEANWRAAGATFVTDVLDDYPRHPFIDELHYSADASRVIAEAIADRLALR